jgi:hypothetical protein
MNTHTPAINRRKLDEKFKRAAALCLLALAAVLFQAQNARAQWTTSGTNTTTTSNVGVGTTTPQSALHVSTATAGFPRGITNEQTSVDNNAALYIFRKSRAGAAAQNGDNIGNLYAEAFDGTNFVSGGRLRFAIDGPVSANNVPTSLQFYTGVNSAGGVERMRISSAGNVGIGTTNPTSKLHVFSGTDAATTMLHFDTGVHGGTAFGVYGTTNNESGFGISVYRAGQYFDRMGVTNYGHIYLEPNASAFGNVGIGTTNPVSKLHVVGDITVTGNINAKYQDVAEWVPSTEKLAVGTVVVLDGARDNHVMASAKSYDTRVAGVISAQPGLTLGEAGEGKALVATTGRVKVKVDASRGAIHVGDLLVTSDVSGVAMLSKPLDLGGVPIHRPGTLIGKALESLEQGTGEILVLLSLQ